MHKNIEGLASVGPSQRKEADVKGIIETAEVVATLMGQLDGDMGSRVSAVDHIKLSSAEWRYAAVYLASQLATSRINSDAARVSDARLALRNIETAVQGWLAAESRREPLTSTQLVSLARYGVTGDHLKGETR